jgi:hypothetical protein
MNDIVDELRRMLKVASQVHPEAIFHYVMH